MQNDIYGNFTSESSVENSYELPATVNLGAALISVNGMGALLASSDPVKEKKLYDIVLIASCLETIALSWSTYSWEFSATVQELIIVPLIMAGLVSVLLLIFRPK